MAVMMRRNSTSFASMLSFDFMDGEGLSQKSDTSLAPLPLRRDSSLQQQPALFRGLTGGSDSFDFIGDMEMPEFGSAGAYLPNGPEYDLFAAADFAVPQQAPLLQQYKGTLSRGSSGDFMAAVQAASQHQYQQQQQQYAQVVKEEPVPSPPRLSNLRANSADGETAAAARKPAAARAPTKKRSRSWSNAAAAAPAARAPRRAAAAAAVVKFEAAAAPAAASASEEDVEEEEEEEEIDESLSADQRELRHKRARNRLHAKVSALAHCLYTTAPLSDC
jgi:hypothetical protein